MATTTTGAFFKRFYQDPTIWTKGGPSENQGEVKIHADFDDMGLDSVSDDAVVTIISGVVEIDGVVVAREALAKNAESVLEKIFIEWFEADTMTMLYFKVPTDRVEQAKSAIRSLGGKDI
jgi:hypothetical protein